MLINVDAGHGSFTAGKRTPPMPADLDINKDGKSDIKKGEQYREHYANVGVANLLVKELKRCGYNIMITGFNDDNATDDPDTALSARQAAIVKANCDMSISIHFNAFGDGKNFNTAKGVGIYIHDKHADQSDKLAAVVLKHLAEGTKQTNRGISKQSLAMCNCNAMSVKVAILVELAFMTNEHEATTMMINEAFWKECAQEICRGVCEYTGVKYIPETYIPSKTITPKSSMNDINWLKTRLNELEGPYFLELNGIYDNKTRISVLFAWEAWGWNKDGNNDGWAAGKKTIARFTDN
jgi:N-acetylmuramoyl-L-alanine amidase